MVEDDEEDDDGVEVVVAVVDEDGFADDIGVSFNTPPSDAAPFGPAAAVELGEGPAAESAAAVGARGFFGMPALMS